MQRLQQAQEVRDCVDSVRSIDRDANVVVLGDLNDFEFSPTVAIVRFAVSSTSCA